MVCILGVAFVATSNVVTKEVMQAVPFLMVSLLWFSFAFIWFCGGAFFQKKNPFPWLFQYWKMGLGIGGMNYLAALTWFYAIDKIGPSVTGFFQRLETPLFLLLGVFLLQERLSKGELTGMFISFVGALLLTFSIEKVLLLGTLMAILHTVMSAVHNYLGKVYVKDTDPYAVGTVRVFYTSLLLLPTVLAMNQFQLPPSTMVPWLVAGTLISPFLGWFSILASLRYLKASQAAIYINLHPFFVLMYSFLLFSTFPAPNQLLGGILIVLGILLALWKKPKSF